MLFHSLTFLVFIAIFVVVYFAISGRRRIWFCLLSSYLFYGWWDSRFLALIVFVTCVNWEIARRIEQTEDATQRKRWVTLSIVVCLAVLGFFKYAGFFVENISLALNALGFSTSEFSLNVLLPVGISFFTFQTLSYTIDVYRRVIPAEVSLLRFATYVAFFPQLVAGPIVRASDFLPQLRVSHRLTWDHFVKGGMTVLWGYFLKCGVADSLAIVVDGR